MAVSRPAKKIIGKLARNISKPKPKSPKKKSTIKVNSNPNKIRAKGERNPTQNKLTSQEVANILGNKYLPVKSNTIKINSSIPKRRDK